MADEVGKRLVFALPVDADAVFDADGDLYGVLHGVQAGGDEWRVLHEAGAECAFLYARAGAAAVEVDFVVAVLFAVARGAREFVRVAAAELQGEGVFAVVVGEVAGGVAVVDGVCVDHFAVEPGVAADLPRHVAVVAVGPVEHGGDADGAGFIGVFLHG